MNIAEHWPGQPADLSSPAEIEAEAQQIAKYQGHERRQMAEAIRGRHSPHVWSMIRESAVTLVRENKSRPQAAAVSDRAPRPDRDRIQRKTAPRRVETPAARASDPGTSHDAAEHVTGKGTRHRQRLIVAQAVAAHPGCTAKELAEYCEELDRYDVGRRLSECKTASDVIEGDARKCNLSGRSALTWYPKGV
ncbi:hypothetical protein V5738_10995 [Salinisphaera sp. SPP-AMP-43]|uniref:hypothetical protein n=1 Tax=Salinisphaera sp. SPP-AMP-43 TaxID=3121288 RepID=UPI003C6E3A7C